MKKLLFLALFSFLVLNYGQASVFIESNSAIENLNENCISSRISVEFQTSSSLDNLQLVGVQQLEFTDINGGLQVIYLTVDGSASIGNTLNADFSTSANLSGLSANENQELVFVHAITGATVTVDFIIIETVMH